MSAHVRFVADLVLVACDEWHDEEKPSSVRAPLSVAG